MIHLITGYAGYEHIKSEDEGVFNASFFGDGQFVMGEGNQFEGSILDNNTVRILDGNLLMYGRHVRILKNTYEDVIISTGTAGMNRIDLICMTYAKNENDGTENAYLEVVKGTETEGAAVEPIYIDGNILEGAVFNQMPLYKVVIEGINLTEIVPVFRTIPTYKALAEQYAAQFEATIKALKGADILDTMEEVKANTQENMFTGALATKELNSRVSLIGDEVETKQPKIKGAAASITDDNLTVARALISDASGQVAVSKVTITELGYLSGAKNNVQTQLDNLVAKDTALTNSLNSQATSISNNASAIANKIKIQETNTAATIKAGHNKVTLTKPSVAGYTFYPILCMGDVTKDIAITGLGTLNLRVYSAVSADTLVNFTTTWLGIK